jgi:rhodanese-related sulfurtransferase
MTANLSRYPVFKLLRAPNLSLLHNLSTYKAPSPYHSLHHSRTMSSISLADLEYISRESLASDFKSQDSPSLPPNTAIVDVRDSDHVGGHIKGSTWVPSSQLDYKTPELIRSLKDKEIVIFHCALSQQRGPSAALRYLREKERLDPTSQAESKNDIVEKGEGVQKQGEAEGGENKGPAGIQVKKQKVYVLKGGFTMWQEKYGQDANLTEGYEKDIWEFGTPDH